MVEPWAPSFRLAKRYFRWKYAMGPRNAGMRRAWESIQGLGQSPTVPIQNLPVCVSRRLVASADWMAARAAQGLVGYRQALASSSL